MERNHKWMALAVIAVGGLVAGAYALGNRNAQREAAERAQSGAVSDTSAHVAASRPSGSLPASHPSVEAIAAAAAAPSEAQREGKLQVDPTQWFTHFRVGSKNVKSIFVDGPLVWVGTSGGVIRYDTASDEYKLFDARNGLLSNGVFHVGKLRGRLVVGTYGGGMSVLAEDGKTWENYNIPQGLADAFVYDVLEAANGDVWIATWSGANRVRGGALSDRSKWDTFTVENTGGGLPNDWVYGLAAGSNGDIWLATEGGLARFRQGAWDNWNHAKGLGAPYEKVKDDIAFKTDPSKLSSHHAKQKEEMGLDGVEVAYNPNYIVSLVVEPNGVVWAGTWGGGLARFDGKKFTNFTVADGLPGNHVFMLHRDENGQLWAGTNNGLARIDGGKFKLKTTADGLFSNTVFSMATSQDGSLWVGSYGGLAHLR